MTDSVIQRTSLPFAHSAADKRQAFRVASRHSRRVRLARRLVLVGGLVAIGGLVVFSMFNPFRAIPIPGASVESVSLHGSTVTMAKPKLSGYRSDGRPYEITASSAVQDLKDPTRFELHDMDARLTMQDSTVTHLTAKTGTYDSKQDLMDLTSEVVISSDGGLDMQARNAHVEFRSGSVSTLDPVSVAMRGNTVTADTMHMIDNGKQVTFEGHVRTTFVPGQGQAAANVGESHTP